MPYSHLTTTTPPYHHHSMTTTTSRIRQSSHHSNASHVYSSLHLITTYYHYHLHYQTLYYQNFWQPPHSPPPPGPLFCLYIRNNLPLIPNSGPRHRHPRWKVRREEILAGTHHSDERWKEHRIHRGCVVIEVFTTPLVTAMVRDQLKSIKRSPAIDPD